MRTTLVRQPTHLPKSSPARSPAAILSSIPLGAAVLVLLIAACPPVAASPTPAAETGDAPAPHDPIELHDGQLVQLGQSERRVLDDPTAYCLECHGNGDAPDAEHSIGALDRSHPVDVAYPSDAGDLVPAGELDPRMILVDGHMTCITCHDSVDPRHRLVLPETEGTLCVACHRR